MPILPLDHPEPFAAVLGVMLYPGAGEGDRGRARAFAAQYLAEPIRQYQKAGGVLPYDTLMRIATDAGVPLDDLEHRWWDATATGEMFKTLFALANTEPALGSWNNAARLAELTAGRNKVSGSRSALWAARKRFLFVAHLWAAWCIRNGRFISQPEVGYHGRHDFQSFLTEAEILRKWGQSWRAPRANAAPPLPAEVWRVPQNWSPPDRKPDWPPTGKIPDLTLSDDLLAELRKPGRPRKTD